MGIVCNLDIPTLGVSIMRAAIHSGYTKVGLSTLDMANLHVSITKSPIIGASIMGALNVASSIMGPHIARIPIMKSTIMDVRKMSVLIMGTATLHAPIMSCSQRAVQFERGTLLRILGRLAPTNRILVGA